MQRFKKYMVHHPLFSKHERHFGQMILYSRQPWYASFASLSAVANRLSGCQDLSRLARKQGSHPAAKTSKLSSWSGHGLAGTLQTSVHFSHIITIYIYIYYNHNFGMMWQEEAENRPTSFRKRRVAKIHRNQQHTQLLSPFQL